jgi:hypothetical protein
MRQFSFGGKLWREEEKETNVEDTWVEVPSTVVLFVGLSLGPALIDHPAACRG